MFECLLALLFPKFLLRNSLFSLTPIDILRLAM